MSLYDLPLTEIELILFFVQQKLIEPPLCAARFIEHLLHAAVNKMDKTREHVEGDKEGIIISLHFQVGKLKL